MKLKQILSSLLMISVVMGTSLVSVPNVLAAPYFATTKEATQAAKKLGYEKTNYITKSGQPVYKATSSASKGRLMVYITPDVDSHKGGAWKVAKTVEDLNSKTTRLGTYNADLSKYIDK